MKKIYLLLTAVLLKTALMAQVADSVTMLPGTVLDVYYNFTTGTKDTVRNNNWHLAFAVRKAQPPYKTMQAATIRINDGRSVELYKSGTSIENWSSFDTSGWNAWPQFYNSDSTWDIGAFNQDRNMANPFDYGWGQYNMTTRDVDGNDIWLMALVTSPNPNDPKMLKKLAIHKIVYDTMWSFSISNLDGTDSVGYSIRKSDYNNKLFAYVNVLNHQVIDREPAINSWDILFTRYKSLVTLFGQTLMYPVMGVLHNPNAISAKYVGADAQTFVPDTNLIPHDNINTIGWDWKEVTTTPGAWPIIDSLAYVVKNGENNYHKIVFTEYFANSTQQFIKFNKTFYSILTSSERVVKELENVKVYPNPASGLVNVDFNFENAVSLLSIEIIDLTGRTVSTQKFNNVNGSLNCEFNLSGLNQGIYFVSFEADGAKGTRKIIVN
ncbi:MAG: T9SS type A sorting domain-containing protein [Bacteroidia bacterium]|nr:T9SS type A sorting domain-containing protein [Bacteroidia bacterium]MCF8426278.1 T9SS type A sorting domain-containing protein [Bacteroidia bacterium]MCF8445483.1 T9SS type A sorting domain-containing protein [Bacteroidia bacterium]